MIHPFIKIGRLKIKKIADIYTRNIHTHAFSNIVLKRFKIAVKIQEIIKLAS